MLDEVIEYLKQLQAQVQMVSRMNMQPMMLPMALQQQLQMSMMAPISMGMAGMGMGMGMGMETHKEVTVREEVASTDKGGMETDNECYPERAWYGCPQPDGTHVDGERRLVIAFR